MSRKIYISMSRFKEWLIKEAAISPQDIQHDDQGRPNFRVYVLNGGVSVGLEIFKGGGYKYEGDMFSNVFGETNLLKGEKLFNWHSDLPEGVGYGPMFYEICMEIATNKGGFLASMTLVNRLGITNSGKDFDYEQAKERKGASGGDSSDRVEGVYEKFYGRSDIEKTRPNIALPADPEMDTKPWMYMLYRKKPTVIPQLIEMNKKGQPVFVSGTGLGARPITSMNF